MGTRHFSLLEQKKMQWAKEREEMAGLCAPWGPPENSRPLRKRLVSNVPEETDDDTQSRIFDTSTIPSAKESPVEDPSLSISNNSMDNRYRPMQRGRHDMESLSPSLPPVHHNYQEDTRQRSLHKEKEGVATRPDGFDGYLYVSDPHGLSKSAENFSTHKTDSQVKRKAFLSGDHLGNSGSLEKITDHSPFSPVYQLRNSNLSIATEGDNTWREWGNARGSGDESRPRWGDRGINMTPWVQGGPVPPGVRMVEQIDDCPTPGWVERGLSRMSGDGRGRRGSAEYNRVDPGIRVIVSDEHGNLQRARGNISDIQNLEYVSGDGINDITAQKNNEGRPVAVSYSGDMPVSHSSSGMPHRTGGMVEGNRGDRFIVVGKDVYNASEIVHNGRQYGYTGCISAPSNKSSSYMFKKNDDVTSSLPNLQSLNTHLRGQNVPVDPDVIVEREMRRLKAMELQKAIRQQLDEREKRRIEEREQRLKEERALEERAKKQQEIERMKKEEEERKHRDKEELENKKAELMREALEAAEQEAQRQRKKRSLRQHEENPHEGELEKMKTDPPNKSKTEEQINNHMISSCCSVITEAGPGIVSQPVQPALDNVNYDVSHPVPLEGNVVYPSRSPSVYDATSIYHRGSTPVAPFKITLPETSTGAAREEGGETNDNKQGGVLIVGRDVYLLPYVNTEVLAPKLVNGTTYSLGLGGIDNLGNRIVDREDNYSYRRDWLGSTTAQLRTTRDVATQTEQSTQGPLLLLLRMAGSEDAQNRYDQRSSTDDSSNLEADFNGAKEKAFSGDASASQTDCCFCHKTCTQSQQSCSKSLGQDAQQKRPTQTDRRPKWGANRPSRKYTTQSEKDPHYSSSLKRPSQGRNKREVDNATTEEGSEDPEQSCKPQVRSKPKTELSPSIANPPCSSGNCKNSTLRNKRHAGKKSSEKTNDAQKPDKHPETQIGHSPLPVLVPPRKEAPKRIQVVKPSLSLDQDSNGHVENQYAEPSGNIPHIAFFPTSQLSPISVPSDVKHLLPPVLPVIQQGRLSPIRITQSPIPPVRICPSPSTSVRICSTPIPPIRASSSPVSSSRQTPLPTCPTPTPQPHQSNRHCSSPPVPAVLAKMRREQAKSPPRQFSFISTAPDKDDKISQSHKEARSITPSAKTNKSRSISSTPRTESKSGIVLPNVNENPSRQSQSKTSIPISPEIGNMNAALLVTPRDELSVCSPSWNISCPSASSPGADASNALMLVTLSEDISIGSPSPNPLSSILEVDDKNSFALVTPSDEISVGLDSRSNFSISRTSHISEGMPDGFWEDVVPLDQLITPRSDLSSAVIVMEQKIEELHDYDHRKLDNEGIKEVISDEPASSNPHQVLENEPAIEDIKNHPESLIENLNKNASSSGLENKIEEEVELIETSDHKMNENQENVDNTSSNVEEQDKEKNQRDGDLQASKECNIEEEKTLERKESMADKKTGKIKSDSKSSENDEETGENHPDCHIPLSSSKEKNEVEHESKEIIKAEKKHSHSESENEVKEKETDTDHSTDKGHEDAALKNNSKDEKEDLCLTEPKLQELTQENTEIESGSKLKENESKSTLMEMKNEIQNSERTTPTETEEQKEVKDPHEMK